MKYYSYDPDTEILTVSDNDYGVVHKITMDGRQYVWSSVAAFKYTFTGHGDKSELAMMLGFNDADLTAVEATFESKVK